MAALTTEEKVRFLQCATFGATPALLEGFGTLSREQWLAREMARARSRNHMAMVDDMWTQRLNPPYPAPFFGADPRREYSVPQLWRAYVEAPDQLHKRVGAALLEIFVVNARVGAIGIKNNSLVTASYVDMLENRAFTTFNNLITGVSKHAAMGHFLSSINNAKATYAADGTPTRIPDENYAREVMQLFTIGLYELNIDGTLKLDASGRPIETYTQDDVFNLARVFTGWMGTRATHNFMTADAQKHSPEVKKFLGLTIPAGTSPQNSLTAALDHLVNHPNVGPFIGKQLIQRLVTANPSPAYVRAVAEKFNDNGSGVRGDMKAVIVAVLTHPEATSVTQPAGLVGIRGRAREPMVRLTAVLRYLGASSNRLLYPIGNLSDAATGIGQSPLKSPSVFNFFRPGYTPPASQLAAKGLVSPELQITTGTQIIGSINTINDLVWNLDTYMSRTKYATRFTTLATDAARLVDDASVMLTGAVLPGDYRATVIKHVSALSSTDWWARTRVAVIGVASSPEFLVQS